MDNKHTIWKFPLAMVDEQIIEMPLGARILCVQTQDKQPTLWALCDPVAETARRAILIFGTGAPIYEYDVTKCVHIGTLQHAAFGPFVWHVFERVA